MQTVLTQEEMDFFKNDKWTTTELFGYLETLMSNCLKELSSGVDLANETLEHSLEFNRIAAEVVQSNKKKELNSTHDWGK